MLGLAGSNSVSLQPAVRIACTDEAFNVKTKHALIKRVTDPWGDGGKKNRQYKTDPELMRRLQEYVSSLPVPYPNPEGRGTNRVPVRLLSNNPDEIVAMRRKMQTGPQLTCECNGWRPKTEEECKRDGLPWPSSEADRERYFVSLPGEDMGATWYTYGPDFKLSEKKQVACNPMKCPYAGAFVPTEKQKAKPCKPETTINCQLGDWGGGELCFVHAESWATAQRFNTALAIVYESCGGNVAGIEVDVCLEYTKAQHVPGGSKTRHPYWAVAIPYGMSETEFRERAIRQRQKLLADVSEMARLSAMTQQLLGEARMEWRAGALLPEFQPYKMLGSGDEQPAVDADWGLDLTQSPLFEENVHLALETLVDAYGMTKVEAIAMFRANASDLAAMFERLGPPPEPVAPEDEEPPAVEGVMEPEDDAPPHPDDFDEGQVEQDQISPTEAVPLPPETEGDVVTATAAPEAPVQGVADNAGEAPGPPVPTPLEAVPPLFADSPATCFEIEDRFAQLVEQEKFTDIVQRAWKQVTGKPNHLIPSPGTCNNDQELLKRLLVNVTVRAEKWWREGGQEKHGAT
jgi:hypothetical protein